MLSLAQQRPLKPPTLFNPILQAWTETLRRRAEDPAILAADGSVLRRFSDIEAESVTIEQGLHAIPAGAVCALQIGNTPAWPALLLALFRRRLVPLPLGRHVEPAELQNIIQAQQVYTLFTPAGQVLQNAAAISSSAAFLKLTSGTSGTPRGIRFTAAQIFADCENVCDTMGFTEADLNYGVIPFSHSYGFSNLVTPLLCRGVPVVATEDRLPRAILAGLQQTQATVFPGMPVFYDKLAALEGLPPLPRLRLCISAGAPLPASLAERFHDRLGRKIHSFYGSSECGGIAYDRSPGPAEEGLVGPAMCGVHLSAEGEGSTTRLAVRGPAVGEGYDAASESATLSDGVFRPPDLVRWTARGLVLAGRASDVINIAGRKLHPAEVEGPLASFPGVKQVIVFGIPSASRGEEAIACVAGQGIDPAALRRHCRQYLSEWQMPRDFWFIPEIPANERGKISRRELAGRYLGSSKN